MQFSTSKLKEYLSFFSKDSYGCKIKASFMLNRNDFLERIKTVADNNLSLPPIWATGCFYGGEIQILLDEHNYYENFCTLAHETFHLVFNKFIYEKNKWDRIVWLDESLAGNFDGTTEKIIKSGEFKELIFKYYSLNLPKIEDLDFSKDNIKTSEYNGYELFKIVGRFLLETKPKEKLYMYLNNLSQIKKDGNTILKDSLKYFYDKYKNC